MQVYISNREVEALAEGLVQAAYNGQRLPKRIEMDVLVNFLGLTVKYENIAEKDPDKIAFASDGTVPLTVWRDGKRRQVTYPKDTIILDRFLLQPEELARRRFTEGHEIGHILLGRADPRHSACFYRVCDTEHGDYKLEELYDRMCLEETQANAIAAHLLMPRSLLTAAVQRHFHRETIPVYDSCVFLPEDKPLLTRMAEQIGVSYTRRGESNTHRFSPADLRPCYVKTLDNPSGFSSGFSLPEHKSARRKLPCTSRRRIFEGFCVPTRRPC